MKQHKDFLDGVQEVLVDDKKYPNLCLYKQKEIDEIQEERQLKWHIGELILEGNFSKKDKVAIPQSLQKALGDIIDKDHCSLVADLVAKEASLQNHDDTLTELMKVRIENLLKHVDLEKVDPSLPLMRQYENALSVNTKGYSIHYKRDVD